MEQKNVRSNPQSVVQNKNKKNAKKKKHTRNPQIQEASYTILSMSVNVAGSQQLL